MHHRLEKIGRKNRFPSPYFLIMPILLKEKCLLETIHLNLVRARQDIQFDPLRSRFLSLRKNQLHYEHL